MQPGDIIHLVDWISPIQSRGVVNIDFLLGKPFYTVGKPEPPADTEKRAKAGPHFRIGMGHLGQAVIIMGLRKMD